jgi:hypothetical protein
MLIVWINNDISIFAYARCNFPSDSLRLSQEKLNGSPDWIRTSDQTINSRLLYRWATEEYYISIFIVYYIGVTCCAATIIYVTLSS